MAAYKNDYSKEEDFVLWQLHEIRNRMSTRRLRPFLINQSAREIIRKYHLSHLKLKDRI